MRSRAKILVSVCLLLTSLGYAYNLMGPKWPAFPVGYAINPSGGVAGNESSIQAGFSTWEALSGVTVSFGYGGTTSRGIGFDGFNTVAWGTSINTAGTLAVTLVWGVGSPNIVEADMEFNTGFAWSTNAPMFPSPYDIQTVALHEAGHFIGIDHTSDTSAIMYPSYQSRNRNLGQDDVAAARALYPGEEILIQQNAPNPFKPSGPSDATTIFFDLSQDAHVTMKIYNIAGELVKELLDEDRLSGSNTVDWFGDNGGVGSRGSGVGSGVYLVVATTSTGGKDVKKMMVIR